MKRLLAFITALSLLLSACGGGDVNKAVPNQETPELEEDSTSENAEDSSGAVDSNEGDSYEDSIATGAGKYINQINSSTIEIETKEEVLKFLLTEEAQEDVKYVEIGEEVRFTYYEKDNQRIIDFIDKSEYYDEPRHHHRHHKHHRHHRHHHHGPPSGWDE